MAELDAVSTTWPDGYDAPPAGWEWTLVDVACGHCGTANKLHEQPPQWLKVGVVWECSSCSGKNMLGGPPPRREVEDGVPGVLECGECHSTHDPAVTDHEIGPDGVVFECPECHVQNRVVPTVAESASASVSGVTQ